ncbi:hypothetical protein OIU77_011539 [Salix suchowensis]|uniref:TLC domain-containing protein n=1 Tax=Salix suchowensis TaxID=1278906 RepID=A0ABQ9A0K7_9ROSI|nr:hypothetical protein OIU77_011539 [Salix suchowensis]
MDALVLLWPTLPRFFAGFISMYFLGYFVFFRNWEPRQRKDASSCLMSLAHGSPAVLMAIRALLHSQTVGSFASPNSALENTVLEFSTAYFLADLLHYMVFFPDETLFILHHIATLYVFVTCRYMIHFGAQGLALLLVLAEVTSACQNVRSIAGNRKADVPAAARLHDLLAAPFYALYSLVRGILGPICLFKMGVFYLNGGAAGLIPAWAWISWMVVIGSAILAAISSELAFAIVGLTCSMMPCNLRVCNYTDSTPMVLELSKSADSFSLCQCSWVYANALPLPLPFNQGNHLHQRAHS